MVHLHPNIIVEPFNHLGKGRTNEYKVSTYPKQEHWQLQPLVVAYIVLSSSSSLITHY